MTATTARQVARSSSGTLRRAFGAAATAAVLVLSACSGAEGGGRDTTPADEQAQALAFAECMRDNGVDMPDPAPGQQGLREALRHEDVQDEDKETFDQALAACDNLAPQFGHGDEAGHEQERDEMMLELADCLREQGIDDVPDDLGGIDHENLDDEFTAALEECRDELGGGDDHP